VKKGMAVMGSTGIVGVVVAVSENNAKVMSLLHRSSRVSAMLKKDNTAGSIEWDGADPSYLILKNIPKSSKVNKGDTVLTSTYSANFPSHLMVGTVSSVVADASSNFFTLKIKTGTNFFALQYVYLVNNAGYAEQMNIENSTEKNP
jgi:rod shape-determining protein MreC